MLFKYLGRFVIGAVFLMPFAAFASGSVGGGGGYGGGTGGSYQSAPRAVDERYEYGKAVFNGRISGIKAYQYCLDIDGEKKPLKRKTIKAYKKKTQLELANAIYDCERPELLVGQEMAKAEFSFLVYYLNKRYRLKLKS